MRHLNVLSNVSGDSDYRKPLGTIVVKEIGTGCHTGIGCYVSTPSSGSKPLVYLCYVEAVQASRGPSSRIVCTVHSRLVGRQ